MQKERRLFTDKMTFDERNPLTSLKTIYDSYLPPNHFHDEECNLSGATSIHFKLKSEKQKKIFSKTVIELTSDPEYAKCAIPTASELYLPEALSFFKNLSTRPLEEIREIKVCRYTNALYCLINYSSKNIDHFFNFLKSVIDSSQISNERCRAISVIGKNKRDYILENIDMMLIKAYNQEDDYRNKIQSHKIISQIFFDEYGDSGSIDLARKYKSSLSRENQILYVKALEEFTNGRFDNYLPEIKRILEVE